MYDQYSFQVIPALGELVAGDWKSYQYLVESIRKFPTQQDFTNMIENAGFRCARYQNMTFGVVAIHSAFKIWRDKRSKRKIGIQILFRWFIKRKAHQTVNMRGVGFHWFCFPMHDNQRFTTAKTRQQQKKIRERWDLGWLLHVQEAKRYSGGQEEYYACLKVFVSKQAAKEIKSGQPLSLL